MEQDSFWALITGFLIGVIFVLCLAVISGNENKALRTCVEKGYDADICQDFLN